MTGIQSYAYDCEVNGILYDLSLHDATVVRNIESPYSGDIVIPESITFDGRNYTVTSIGDYAFYDCSELFSITLPNTVVTIGMYAFGDCYNLKQISLSSGLTTIKESAFWGCGSLTSIEIPNSVTTIENSVFLMNVFRDT